MSRIQNLLNKAEREGTVRRTRALVDETPTPALLRHDRGSSAVEMPPQRPRLDVVEPPSSVREPEPDVRWAPDVEPIAEPEPRSTGRIDSRLIAALAPMSLAAEQYRSLRTRIRRVEANRPARTLVITSPSKGDGKSLTAANLALTMAQEFQQRVLLIDADLRRPSVHQLFALGDGPGLADVLMGAAEIDQALVSLTEHHLAVLPAGAPPAHPTELLGSATMRRVLDTLRTRYDRILIDTPPIAPLADVNVLSPLTDGVLMIVRAGVTSKPAIERALQGMDASKVLGLVLNESGNPAPGDETYGGYGYIGG
jgi:protein-tyrosine kinase